MTLLQVAAGHASRAGSREQNEDFCGYLMPTGGALAAKGVLLAVADGVSGSSGGRESAEYAVRGLLADYYATPDTWSVPHALDRVINAVNQWLIGQAVTLRGQHGLQSTLSTIVFRGRRFYVAHVGDSRVYLLREGRLRRLTVDHVWDRPEMQHVLTRAIGLDERLMLDHSEEALEPGDRFALVSDGVWEPLGDQELERLLAEEREPGESAAAIVNAALARGGTDNATAVVARIDGLPESALQDAIGASRDLAPPPRLRVGQRLDGFEVLALMHESRETLLYKVRHEGGMTAVLKTLPPAVANDGERRAALLAEEWLARRLVSHYFPQVLPLDGHRTALYYVTTFHEGATLQQNLDAGRHFSVAESVGLGIRLLKGLGALHRRDVVHCDVKPANVHLGADERLRILDFGVARSAALKPEETGSPGTPSFMAPELLTGSRPDAASDLYAAGVTLYHLLTRKYPYGEIEPFQRPRFTDPVPPTRYRPDIPGWLDAVLLKAVARDKPQRFETAEEFLLALERGERQPITAPPRTPLAARDPLRLWQSIAAAAIVLNLLLLYLLVLR
jgi:protein phosphatase